jgi:predicted ATP-grasp superfamily ATP-dependent carboligase
MLSKTLAAVRSLGSQGIETLVSEKTRWNTSGFSKYCSKSLLCPDPQKNPEKYVMWLKETLRKEKCDVLLVMDDDTSNIVIEHREELEALCAVPLPPTESYLIAADKGKTLEFAYELGIPCPQTIQFDFNEIPDKGLLLELTRQIQYPLVIKPKHSSGSRGIRFVNNEEEFLDAFISVHQIYRNPLVQEFIPRGPKYDVCLCYDANHILKASFIQKQIRNYPIDRGPSTVHQSVEHPELLALAKKLMDNLCWYGVADIEFMIDPRNGEPKLMEINPRFWSSVHLSIRSGVDFPWILYQLALKKPVEPVMDYVVGKIGRAILPGDFLHFLSNPKRWEMNPPFWSKTYPDDTISTRDPLPTLGFFLSVLRYGWQPQIWRFLLRR